MSDVSSNTFFTNVNTITLDSIYFTSGSRVQCHARAVKVWFRANYQRFKRISRIMANPVASRPRPLWRFQTTVSVPHDKKASSVPIHSAPKFAMSTHLIRIIRTRLKCQSFCLIRTAFYLWFQRVNSPISSLPCRRIRRERLVIGTLILLWTVLVLTV